MTTKTEGFHTAEFLVSEAEGHRSRDTGTVRNASADDWPAGTILGIESSGGNYIRHDTSASDGSEDEKGILFEDVLAGETVERTIIVRDAEVNKNHLTYEDAATDNEKTATDAALKALGIIVRT